MGRLDQYAKEIFAEETAAVTHGGAAWQPPAELNLTEVRLDGRLLVRDAARLLGLAAPWSEASAHDEIVVEIKMQGDHLNMPAVERGLLRRQARQVQRMEEDPKIAWEGDLPFWMAASHVPAVLHRRRAVREVAPGCYRIEPYPFPFLWIAANELPLRDELIPFLIARTGRALDDLGRWVQTRRPPDWLSRMVEFLPMSIAVHEELLRFVLTKSEDPEIKARQKLIAKVYIDMTPEAKAEVKAEMKAAMKAEMTDEARQEGLDKGLDLGHLTEARSALRRVLARRKLALVADEEACIDACTDLTTLERWLDQAVDAPSAAEALK
jgi:hypothetical protein